MSGTRVYPDEPVGSFPSPPTTFEDTEGRSIEIRVPDAFDDVIDDVVDMYEAFDPTDRAQGIPPTGEKRIRGWLETIADESINVVARHGEDVVGHAMLVPDAEEPPSVEDGTVTDADVEWELAIFVLQEFQRAGNGTALLETLLGHASDVGITHVWLTVERWNSSAIALYERVGFEAIGSESFEQEMTILLH
ncbi:GNAT family N-acetyltransferase [Natronobacterium gregoryi]|uniref:Acetyltransferase n=2 Tax=Natronobacterium gregoryi TaxID=44930 RepID=L0AGU1_NATGS|nr:GNAT family N-acetyltransferase [Natronobacterium gregoryi]AFZ73093.1 acetyltransferase [Natronobacterium gregoryi SP2]ELY70808.1 GCN5-like N-acetyltransferase [Natronobacterium gregoryi SP2]PLK20387.1 N-acetyltransferase [Natronobacterium gregoryi SP2]SFI61327.1 Acetyltransferase (GNAT) family protein [Natronobacterium gregoryi]